MLNTSLPLYSDEIEDVDVASGAKQKATIAISSAAGGRHLSLDGNADIDCQSKRTALQCSRLRGRRGSPTSTSTSPDAHKQARTYQGL